MDPLLSPSQQHSNAHHRQIQYHEAPYQRNNSLPGLPNVDVTGADAVFHHGLPSFPQAYDPASQVPGNDQCGALLAPARTEGDKMSGAGSLVPHVREANHPVHVDGPGCNGSSSSLNEGRPSGPKFVLAPPNLVQWRQRLFDLDGIVAMDHEEFETYFPHIDNVYSHRSTQRYKRKPFVTHYWDCRMKGRPPGTPKSDDPNKKKRKRLSRARDLCDVKIKITEYFAGAAVSAAELGAETPAGATADNATSSSSQPPPFPFSAAVREALATGITRTPLWTIQRVSGSTGAATGAGGPSATGSGNGGLATHQHDLAKSDEIKKNSVQRWLAARERDAKRGQRPSAWRPSGAAAVTAKRHAKEAELRFYAACFCPFSQRVWIALEAKGLPYQYCETDPFRKPKPTQLLEANPRGLVPAIRQGEWACGESAVILEYLEDLDDTVLLRPTDPRLRANCRLWIDFINTKMVPSFYGVLNATDAEAQKLAADKLWRDIMDLVQAADEKGPYFLGDQICLVDIHLAPFALRLSRILALSRGWSPPEPAPRWKLWVDALEGNAHVKNTLSADALYRDTVGCLSKGGQSLGASN